MVKLLPIALVVFYMAGYGVANDQPTWVEIDSTV